MPTDHSCQLVITGPGGERRIELEGREVVRLGRDDFNDVALEHHRVSRHHARVEQRPNGRHLLLDAGSRNGTFLNGARLTFPVVLSNGDRFIIGPYHFEYRTTNLREPTASPLRLAPTDVQVAYTPLTALVVDLHDFSMLAQRVDTVVLAGVLGAWWREAAAILQECGAAHRQPTGDGFLAVWTHESETPSADELTPVLTAALRVARAAERIESPFALRLGAGISTGTGVVGAAGQGGDNTALGETVNRAFRLEAATRKLACDCAVSEATWRLLSGAGGRRHRLELKGYAEPVDAVGFSFNEIEALVKKS